MKSIKIFSEKTHWTAVHNLVFDVIMPRVSPIAFKVLMFFVRQTKGHNRRNFSASYSDITVGAGRGLKSKESVSNALQELLALGNDGKATSESLLIRQVGTGPKDKMRYALNPHYTVRLSFKSQYEVTTDEPAVCGTDSEPDEVPEVEASSSEVEPTNGTDSELPDLAPIRSACDSYRRTEEEPIAPSEHDARVSYASEKKSSSVPSAKDSKQGDMPLTNPYFIAVCNACKIVTTRMSVVMRRRVQKVARAFLHDSIPVENIAVAASCWPLALAPVPEQLMDRFEALMAQASANQASPTATPNPANANHPRRDSHDTPFFYQPRQPFLSAAERRANAWDDWLGELCEIGGGSENYGATASCG